jgi:hypothetical protein
MEGDTVPTVPEAKTPVSATVDDDAGVAVPTKPEAVTPVSATVTFPPALASPENGTSENAVEPNISGHFIQNRHRWSRH